MATRVIAAQDKTTSGAGDDVQIKAGNANTSGAGGHIIIQPGAQATTGGNGLLIIRQPSGVAGTDEIQLSHDGGKGSVINKDGVLQLGGSHIALRTVANNAKANLTAGTIYCDALYSSNIINADGQTNDSYSWGIDSSTFNWNQNFHIRVGWAHIKGYSNCGIAYTGSNTNGRRATLEVTDGSTGGGAWAYRSSTTTVNTSYNDLNLSGHSAFQRLNATAATTITGIAPASTAGGSGTPTWIHTDGRIFWLYNVGTFNITLKHDSASSTAGNRLLTETGGDLIIGPGRYAQLVYDGTSSRWRATAENYPYVFPTADGTNGQVLTTNGSGSLSWATVSAGASASGTTNYIAKFTGASTLGNSLLYDDGSNVGIGTTSPLGRLDVVGANTYEPIRAITNSASNLESGANATVGLSVNNSNTTAGNGIAISFATATTNSNLYGVGAVGFNSLTHTTLGVPQGNFQVITRDAGGGLTPKLTINTSGNIGFGTTSPDKRLTIAANGPSPGITIYKSPDGTLNSAQLVAALGTGSSNTNAGTTGGNEYGILQLNHSGTVRCQFYANAGGAAGSNFVLDGVSFGTTATSAGQVYIIPANAASKALVVRGAGSQSANLTEWQNDSGTVLASVDNLGRHIKSYNSASGLSTFSVGKTVLGAVHFANPAGTNTSTRNEAAITFRGDVATEAQAGIYVTNDNSTGTHMAFATTDSYATGPQLALTITNAGVVNFPRARPTYAGASLTSTAGGTANYVSKFSDSATVANSQIFDNGTNVGIGTATNLSDKVNIYETSAPIIRFQTSGNQYGARIGFWANNGMQIQCATANQPIIFYTANTSNDAGFERMRIKHDGLIGINEASPGGLLQITTVAATKGLIVKGAASQSANLTEWQDNTGTVVAAVSPNGAFTGSSFTPYGTFNSTTTIFGNNYWTPNLSGVSNPSTGTFTKTAATAAWDSQVYSSEGYIKNVYCAARASQTNAYIMFGLNNDPTTDGSYGSLDYAWYFRDGTVEIYEGGGLVSNYGAYTTSTVLSVTYDGSNVQYWKDGVIQRTVARSTGNPLYFDTSFLTQNASLNNVQFGPIGQPFGISGTSGYLPKFTSQQTLGNSIVYDNGTSVGINTSSPAGVFTAKAASSSTHFVNFQNTSGTTVASFYSSSAGHGQFYVNDNTGSGKFSVVAHDAAYFNLPAFVNNKLEVACPTVGTKGLIVKAFLGQTANLTEWQNSTGTALSIVDASGRVGVGYSGSLDAVAGYSYSLRTGGNILLPNTGQIGFLNSTAAGAYATIQYNASDKLILSNFNAAGLGISVDGGVERFLLTNTTATFKTLFTVGVEGVSSSNVNFYVKAASGQTANIQEWRNNAGTTLSAINSAGSFTNNGGYSQSEEFGNGATVSNSYATAIGYAAVAGQLSTAVGANAITSGVTSTALGADANADGGSTAVGRSAAASGGSAVAIGVNSSAVGNNSIAIGRLAASNGGIAIGYNFTGGGVGYTNFNASTNGLSTTGAIAVYAGDGATNGNFSRQYSILGTWATATYASRLGRVQLRVNDYTTDREAIRYESDGANALTSIGGSAIIASTTLAVQSAALANKGLVVRGASGQSANLTEWQNNAGARVGYVDSSGNLTVCGGSSSYVGFNTSTDATFPNYYIGMASSGLGLFDNVWNNTFRFVMTNGGSFVMGDTTQASTSGPRLLLTTGPDVPAVTGANRKGLVIKGSASQVGNLQEWQNSSGTALAYMDANGNFFAVSKSFLIDHPTPAKAAEGKKLRYASLEGPENGVYFRGRLEGENVIILPDYWVDLVDPDSITINLTARKHPQPNLFVVDANAERVVIESDRQVCCDFIVYATRKDIPMLEVEPDGN